MNKPLLLHLVGFLLYHRYLFPLWVCVTQRDAKRNIYICPNSELCRSELW